MTSNNLPFICSLWALTVNGLRTIGEKMRMISGICLFGLCVAGCFIWPCSGNAQQAKVPELVLPLRHADSIDAIAMSADGKWFATAGLDKTIRIWSFPECIHLRTISTQTAARSLVILPGTKIIVDGDEDGTVRSWDAASGLRSGEPIHLDGLTGRVDDVVFSPDGTRLAVFSLKVLHVFDWQSRKELWHTDSEHEFQELVSGQQVVFSPDG